MERKYYQGAIGMNASLYLTMSYKNISYKMNEWQGPLSTGDSWTKMKALIVGTHIGRVGHIRGNQGSPKGLEVSHVPQILGYAHHFLMLAPMVLQRCQHCRKSGSTQSLWERACVPRKKRCRGWQECTNPKHFWVMARAFAIKSHASVPANLPLCQQSYRCVSELPS